MYFSSFRILSSGAAVCAAALLLVPAGCSDGDPTGPSSRLTLTDGAVYDDGVRIRRVRRDSPSRNTWFHRPDAETGSVPPEGADAPSLVYIRVTDFPEAASGGGEWVGIELEGRGLPVPLGPGRYDVEFVPPGERLEPANLGVFTAVLRIGRGIGGLERTAQAVGGEVVITRITRDAAPSRRLLLEGRIELDLVDEEDGIGSPPTLRAVFSFRSSYTPS